MSLFKAPVLAWDSETLIVYCPFCERTHKHEMNVLYYEYPQTASCPFPRKGMFISDTRVYEICFPFDPDTGKVAYEIDKVEKRFVRVGEVATSDYCFGDGDGDGEMDVDVEVDLDSNPGSGPDVDVDVDSDLSGFERIQLTASEHEEREEDDDDGHETSVEFLLQDGSLQRSLWWSIARAEQEDQTDTDDHDNDKDTSLATLDRGSPFPIISAYQGISINFNTNESVIMILGKDWTDEVLDICEVVGHDSPQKEYLSCNNNNKNKATFYASHAVKQLIAYFISRHSYHPLENIQEHDMFRLYDQVLYDLSDDESDEVFRYLDEIDLQDLARVHPPFTMNKARTFCRGAVCGDCREFVGRVEKVFGLRVEVVE